MTREDNSKNRKNNRFLNRRTALFAIGVTAADIAFNGIEALAREKKKSTRERVNEALVEKDGRTYMKTGNLLLPVISSDQTGAPREYVDALNTGTPIIEVTQAMLNEKVTDNFKLKEFAYIPQPARNRGTGIKTHMLNGRTYHQFIRLDPDLPGELQTLREEIDMPLSVLSPYRNVTYNRKCGGAKKSRHKAGQAADLTCSDVKKLHELAKEQFEDGGVGYYPKQNFVHVDVRGYKARWTS